MHSVFRIGQIKQIEDHLWKINLTLIDHQNKQMRLLNELGLISDEMGEYLLALEYYQKSNKNVYHRIIVY
jgi:hypothetical protein